MVLALIELIKKLLNLHSSFVIAAKLFMGSSLTDGTQVAVNPLVLSAWAGLLINAINSIPVGELDGGRISQALWGRKVFLPTHP
jgi:membrane-associated protease RseP (regulator of RpoE activity)